MSTPSRVRAARSLVGTLALAMLVATPATSQSNGKGKKAR